MAFVAIAPSAVIIDGLFPSKFDAHVKAFREHRWLEERREMTRQAWAGVVAEQAKMFAAIRARRALSHEDKLAIEAADPYALYRAPLVRA